MTRQFAKDICRDYERASRLEWILTNGIGGYAMGTVSGVNSRRYHGYLIAALSPPADRMLLVGGVECTVTIDGCEYPLSTNQYRNAIYPRGDQLLVGFESSSDRVSWTYEVGSVQVRKTLELISGRNAAILRFESSSHESIQLELKPLVAFKPHHDSLKKAEDYVSSVELTGRTCNLARNGIGLDIEFSCGTAELVQDWYFGFEHQRELERGLEGYEDRYCPLKIRAELKKGNPVELIYSLTSEAAMEHREIQLKEPESEVGKQLAEACAIFLTRTRHRTSIIAGYPWFSDWGRDTMISLPGALICTGNLADARQILLDYARWMRNGLIPNRFTEAGTGADYNSVDSTLWFINAAWKCLESNWDEEFAKEIAPAISEAIESYRRGTDFGIQMDPNDCFLTQGAEGLQLTWMDAKLGDWVVTARGGKAVEINALWINALECVSAVLQRIGKDCSNWRHIHRVATDSFQSSFWNEERDCYFDVIDHDDGAIRPNQVLGMALPFSPMVREQAIRALDTVTRTLYTPNGLRTLDPKDPAYHGTFTGSMPERDAAYHQGTAWPWLLGSYASALVRLKGDRDAARLVVLKALESLDTYGIGGIAEVFDGDSPQNPGGCPWQAWSVAELLRVWEEDHLDKAF